MRIGAFLVLLAGCALADMRPAWVPERPSIAATWYEGLLEHRPRFLAIERPDRGVKKGRELVLGSTFTEPSARAWAATATQVDVVDYEIVVLHGLRAPAPPQIAAKLGDERGPIIRQSGLVDGRWAFVLDDGTWVFAAMGYMDHVRARLQTSRPPMLAIPEDVNQLVLVNGPPRGPRASLAYLGPIGAPWPPPGLEWVLLATKTDGTFVSHAHYTNSDVMESHPRPHLPITEEVYRRGPDLYSRGY